MPRISLLVPCYNAARFAANFWAMVRSQAQPYDEVLFYDDGSNDDTVRILNLVGAKVLSGSPNRGAAHARNRLLEAATADYVHFHDIDDELDPRFVATLAPFVAPHQAAFCAFQRRRPDGSIEREDRFRDLPAPVLQRPAYFLEHFLTFNATLYPRAVLVAVGGFNERLRIHEDLNLLLRLTASGLRYHYVDEILTTWNLRADSTFHSADQLRILTGQLDCLTDLWERWPVDLRRELGPRLLELAWSLRALDAPLQTQRAALLAERCGMHSVRNRGRRIHWLSALLGPARYYRFFARR